MHLFKAFTLLATIAFAAVAVASPAPLTEGNSPKPTTAVAVKRDSCGLVDFFGGIDALISGMAQGECKSNQT
jgi:hypothetical protein